MGSVAVDSGVIIALFDSNDVHHAWSMEQIEDGSWVRYDDHVAAIKLMQSEVEKLEEQIAELNENLRDAKLEAKDFQNMLRGFK